MPEPVVNIEPAASAADTSEELVENAADGSSDDNGLQPDDPPASGKGKASVMLAALARLGSGVFVVLVRGLWVLAEVVARVGGSYPRHSMAAAASVLILGAIWYTQRRAGDGARLPVPIQIKGESSAGAAKDATKADDPKTEASTATATATPAPTTTAVAGKAEPPKPVDPVTAQAAPSPSAGSSAPAPAPAATEDVNPPLPTLAAAPTDAKETEPAPGKDAVPADLAAAGKHEPAPSPAAALAASTPTLLAGSLPEPAPPPSSPAANDNKASGDAPKPAPAVEAPAPVALTLPQGAPGEPAPLAAPAPNSDALQLATRLEPAGDPNQSTQAPGANSPDTKLKDALAPAETKSAPEPKDAPKSGPAPSPSPPISPPESTKIEPIQPEPPKSETPRAQEPVPAAVGPAPKADVPVVPPAALELPTPGGDAPGAAKPASDAANTAKPAVAGPAAPVEASTPADQKNAVSQPAMPAPLPVAAAATALPLAAAAALPLAAAAALDRPKAAPATVESETPAAAARPEETPPKPSATQNLDGDGFVSVPNSGKLPVEDAQEAAGDSAHGGAAGETRAPAARDARAHAAKDGTFELESPRSGGTPDLEKDGGLAVAAAGAGTAIEARSRSTAGRVEAVPHVVERNENFWTISRLYYSSGRYYRALWKANADTYPDIKKLKINDVINIPPVEDLDPTFIDPPRGRTPADLSAAGRPAGSLARGKSHGDAAEIAESSVSSSVAARDVPNSTGRTNRDAVDGVPVRRSSRTDPDLDLPSADAVARRAPAPDRTGRRADRSLGNGEASKEEPASRTAARPGAAAGKRPVYKIRPYDTLRSIARDMLGDSHRSSEILDLNRDLIDDPSHLIIGQVLSLPEDARTSVRRSASTR